MLLRAVFLALLFLPGVLNAGVFTVVNSSSTGAGSLAQAVNDANALHEANQIVFAIPGPGVHKIDLSKTLLEVGFFITIDGYTQPGASPNTLSVGDNAVILIQLDGGGPFATRSGGLRLGTGCVLRGLSITGFSGPSATRAAIDIGNFIDGDNYNSIEGNFIGLLPDGVTLSGNDYGIYFSGFGNENVIGGNTPAERNIISGNRTGLYALFNSTIVGNYFGTDATGFRQGYGNGTAIVTFNNVIGTAEPGAANVITGNGVGILVYGENSIIRGNLIGPHPDGSPSFGNGTGIIAASQTTIGGLEPGEANVIAFNVSGVNVFGSQNSILSNLFYGNSFMDIDLAGDGPTANDYRDQDSGPNNLQNFPVIISVARDSGNTTVTGGLNSTASTSFTLQFFANGPTSTPGQKLLGTKTLTTNSAGDASFQFTFPIATSTDEFITATATDPNGNTSEFFPPNGAVELANISTRGNVSTGDNILIAGFILNSSSSTRSFLVRALGPSLNINGALADPQLEVKDANGALVGRNDNWRDFQEQQIEATGLAPTNDREAALIVQLSGQRYTVQVSGVNSGTGIGTVEVYALAQSDSGTPKQFRNISTRGNVGTGDNVLIGGTIVQGSAPQKLIVRAIGPDLAAAGVPGSLQDPTLELRDAQGNLLAANDDWRSDQEQDIISSGLAPQDDRDAAILTTLFPTSYTAIVRGKNGGTGIALVEIYKLD
jgi:hypothetical protein